jgi:hypothetical protein
MVMCEQLKDAPTGRMRPGHTGRHGRHRLARNTVTMRCGHRWKSSTVLPHLDLPRVRDFVASIRCRGVPAVRERFALSLSTAREIADAKEALEAARCFDLLSDICGAGLMQSQQPRPGPELDP